MSVIPKLWTKIVLDATDIFGPYGHNWSIEKATMSTHKIQVKINLPEDVKRWLETQAAKNLRSQNAEIVLALRAKMKSSETKKADASA